MRLPCSRPPLFTSCLLAGGLAALLLGSSWALNPGNAGPQTFEIKFKLPPPKPLSPQEELATFKLAPGFHAELVAAEPMVDTPVSISWDEHGRMFVLEMRGYMHDVEGAGEDQPTCRVVMLESTKGDGKLDKRTVFADGLTLARAIMCVNGGLLVGEPPMLWFMKDTNGDGKADVKEPVDPHFGSRTGQPEHMVNSPTWLQDNWIYCANHNSRYRLKDGKFLIESSPSQGQWGYSQDDYGRPFYNYNSDFLRADYVPAQFYQRNPNFPSNAGAGVQLTKDQSTFPSHPTPGVNRGYEAKQLREDGTLATCTATCGAGIYRGGLFPAEYAGNAFIPEPAGNLVKRMIVDEKNGELTAHHAYPDKEFWTSTDERFRPCNAYTGPDGALYVVDMYRGVIQHKGFLTHYLIQNIKDRKLEEPYVQGRIWRVVPDGVKPVMATLPKESAGLVQALSHQNGWVRDTAQRLLVERKDASVVPALTALVKSGAPLAKIHALWALEGMGLPAPGAVTAGLHDSNPKVRVAAVRSADRAAEPELAQMINDPSIEVQVALAFVLGPLPEAQEAIVALARKAGGDLRVRDAIVCGLRGRELEVLQALLHAKPAAGAGATPEPILAALAQAVVTEKRSARVKQLLTLMAAQPPNSPEQLALLSGGAGKVGKSAKQPKLIYLDSEAPEFAALLKTADAREKPLLAALNARIGWPNKPGFPAAPVVKPLTADEQKLFETGKTVYNSLCGACHQPTGVGMPGLAPPLVDSEWVLGNPKLLPRIVIHGLSGPLKVQGQEWSLEMPPLGPALSDEQIAGVLTYIRREWEHGASPIQVKDVADIRSEYKARTIAWTSEELAPKPAGKKENASASAADSTAPKAD